MNAALDGARESVGGVCPQKHDVQKQLLSRAKVVLAELWTSLAQEMGGRRSLIRTLTRSTTQCWGVQKW